MPVFIDVALQLAKNDGDKAAKELEKWAVDVGKDLNSTLGGVLEHMFDHFDTSKPTAHLRSLQDEFAKTARAAADASRIQVSSAGNVEVAIRRLQEAHNKYADSSSQVAAAENRLVNVRALSTQAANDAAAAANTASAAHNALGAASEGAGAAAEGMGSGMLLAAGGIAAAGAAAVIAGKELYDMGEMWADVSDKITFETGKIGADAAAMTDQIAKIGDKTAAPISAIGDVYTQLGRLKDLQGDTLNDLTKQISDYDEMAKKFGGEPLNVTEFAKTMQEFNVPASQVGADLDILKGSADNARIPLNELISTLHEAGPTADIAGLSFGQMTNVLATLEDSGVDVDKALKGIQLGLTGIAKDSPALQKLIKFTPDENELQRLKDVIEKIHELQQSGDGIDADKLGTAAFGRGWQTIVSQIEQGKLNVDDFNTSLGQTEPGIEAQRSATERFGDDWLKVKNQIEDALRPLSEDVFSVLDEGMKEFGRIATVSLGDVGDALDKFMHGDYSGFGHILDEVSGKPGPSTHGSSDPDAFKNLGPPANKPGPGTGATTADIDTSKPYHPLDLNPADKPPGAETYDEWVSSQRAVQSALNRQADTGEALAEKQKRLQDLQDSGKATQEELNTATLDASKALRDNQEATQDLTIEQKKYIEEANKTKRGDEDNYDPFKEATKHSKGLIPELAGLFSAAAINQALGNPYGKLQAAKRGEDPSNPLYVSDVGPNTSAGIPGYLGRLFANNAIGQAPPPGAGGGLPPTNAPAGSIPAMLQPGTGPPGTHQWWGIPVPDKPTPGAPDQPGKPTAPQPTAPPTAVPSGYTVPTGGNAARDKNALDIITQARAMGFNKEQTLAALGVGIQETDLGTNPRTNVAQDQSGTVVQGEFQQDGGYTKYGDRTNPSNAAKGFLSEFARRGLGLNDPNPWHHAVSDVQIPAPAGHGGYNDATGDYLKNLQRGAALDYYNRLAGGDAPPNTPGGPPQSGGPPPTGYASGGNIASSDTVPAMLTPGEEVVKKDAAEKYRPELEAMNAGQDPHKPKAGAPRVSPSAGSGPAPSSRQPLGSVTPPPAGPRVGQGTGSGFGIGGGLIGFAENAAITAAMAAAAMSTGGEVLGFDIGGPVPGTPTAANPGAPGGAAGGGGSTGGGGGNPSGASGDPLTAVLNRTVGYVGQLGAIGAGGLMSSLIPGASQKGGIMDGGILSKVVGGFAGAHPSAPNTAGQTPVPLAPPAQSNQGQTGGDTHIGTQGVSIGTLINQNGQSGQDLANDLAFKSYAGYGSR